jgi:hypothetical protein
MSSYHMNETAFDLPNRQFVDKTIHALEYTIAGGKTLGVFVHRRAIEAGKELRELVDDSVALNEKRLSAFAVLDAAEAAIGGLPGIMLRTRWRHQRVEYYQLQAYVAREGTLLIFAVSAQLDEQAACDEVFDCILQSVTWRAD